jgi:uncharacterized protein (TIGR03067 family)
MILKINKYKIKRYLRSFGFLFVMLLFGNCVTSHHSSSYSNPLNGTWIPVSEEINGMVLPNSLYTNQKLILLDSTYAFQAESLDKGKVTYSDSKMDIYGIEGVNAGKHFTALYTFKNDQLTICYNLLGDSYPTAFETKSKPSLFLSVFKKE